MNPVLVNMLFVFNIIFSSITNVFKIPREGGGGECFLIWFSYTRSTQDV